MTTATRAGGVRFLAARPVPIVPATDLGGVVTLKHGNLYLLSDHFGDMHPDSRGLGLYSGDTRILSCSALRINGLRPLLLQASAGGNYRGTVELTNPDFHRDGGAKSEPDALRGPDAGAKAEPILALARRSLGIQRERILGGALMERITVANYSDGAVDVAIELDVASDHADMFEVRGYPRPRRGEQLPIAIGEDRITFRYVGLDGCERATYLAFSDPCHVAEIADDRRDQTSGAVSATWDWTIPAGGRRELEWRVWADERPAARSRSSQAKARTAAVLFPEPPRVSPDEGATAYRAWSAAPRRSTATTRCSTSPSSEALPTCAC